LTQFEQKEATFSPQMIVRRLGIEGTGFLEERIKPFETVDLNSLLLQLSLHLPRFSGNTAFDRAIIEKETSRLAERLHSLRRPYKSALPSESTLCGLDRLVFAQIEDEIAQLIHSRFHYLLSHRSDSIHFGLKFALNAQWPLVCASLSPFDLSNVSNNISEEDFSSNAVVLSRVFAFPQTPRNAISHLLAQICKWILQHLPEVHYLLTYVNPNTGFNGASYKADNWVLLGTETGVRYRYVNSNYVTERSYFRSAKQSSDLGLSKEVISFSQHELLPLKIFVRSLRHKLTPMMPRRFPSWIPRSTKSSKPINVAAWKISSIPSNGS